MSFVIGINSLFSSEVMKTSATHEDGNEIYIEVEPNNQTENANAVPFGAWINGGVVGGQSDNDADWFKFTTTGGITTITVDSLQEGINFTIKNEQGEQVFQTQTETDILGIDIPQTTDEFGLQSGTYYLKVTGEDFYGSRDSNVVYYFCILAL